MHNCRTDNDHSKNPSDEIFIAAGKRFRNVQSRVSNPSPLKLELNTIALIPAPMFPIQCIVWLTSYISVMPTNS